MMLEGAGHRVTETAAGRRPGRPDGPGRTVRSRAHGQPRARGVGRPRRPDRSAVRLRGHDRDARRSSPPVRRWCARRPGRTSPRRRSAGRRWRSTSGGVVHNVVADDGEAIDLARRYLGHFPLNAWEPPPRRDGPGRRPAAGRPPRADPSRPPPALSHPAGARRDGRRRRTARRATRLRAFDRHRPRPPRRTQRGHRGQRPECDGRHHRQRRGRQGRPLPRRGRCLRAALRLPGRQPRGAGRHRRRAAGHPPPRGAPLRRAAPPERAQAARHPAQGVRVRILGHGHEPVRRPDHHPGLPLDHPRAPFPPVPRPAPSTIPKSGPAWPPNRPGPRWSPAPGCPTTTSSTPASCATPSWPG